MKKKFYDVKTRAFVNTDVIGKIKYPNGRFAVKGATKDGRGLTLFVKEADFAACDAPEVKPAAKKCCKKACCKK